MKKILIIVPYNMFPPHWGGASRNYNLVKQLANDNKIFLLYNDYKQIEKHSIECEEYIELASNPNVKIISVKSVGKFSQLYNPRLIKQAKKIIQNQQIHFILCEHLWSGFHAILLQYLTKIPFILDEHNVEFLRFERMKRGNKFIISVLKWFERFVCKKAHSVLCVSEIDKNYLISKLNLDKYKIKIVPNGIDLEKFFPNDSMNNEIRKKLGLVDEPIILFFGKLDYIPNREAVNIIKSELLPRVLKENSSAKFLIVGDNPPRDIYHKNIIFTGIVKNIEDYINASDVVISPLISGGGTRFKILEALACGKVVISTKIGAEGLSHKGVENFLKIHDDWNEFSKAILQFLSTPFLKNQKIDRSYFEAYSWDIIRLKFNEIF